MLYDDWRTTDPRDRELWDEPDEKTNKNPYDSDPHVERPDSEKEEDDQDLWGV